MKIIGKIYIEAWAEFIYRHGLLVEIRSKHPVHKTLKTEYIVQASIPCPWRAGWGSLHCISQISKLLYRNYVSYVKTLSGTRQRPQLPSTCCQDLGRGCCSDPLQIEGVHLTPELLHKVEMSCSVWHGSAEHTTRTILYYQELNILSSRIIEYHFLNSGHWPQLHWCPRKF